MYMLTPDDGVDPMDQLERMESGPPRDSEEGAARMRRVASALRAAEPRFEASEIEWEGRKAVELTAEDGVQITLWPDHADFNFPYWDSLDARRITDDVEKAAGIIAADTGWRLYDPQLEKWIDPASDAGEVHGMFDHGRGKLSEIVERDRTAAAAAPGERKSFLKRLFGG
jgi:hypothetical protein